MVGVPGRNRLGTIKLLGQQGAREQMRPGQRAKGQGGIAAVQHRAVQSFRAADDEAKGPTQASPAIQQRREASAVRGGAFLVHRDDEPILRQGGEQRGGFPPPDLGRRSGCLRDLRQGQGRAQSRGVAGEEIGLRPGAHAPDRDQARRAQAVSST